MLLLLVLLTEAVTSQAGVIHHPGANFGLRYPVASGRGISPAVIRSFVSYPKALDQNIHGGLISHSGLPVVFNPMLNNHGSIRQFAIASTRMTPPRILPLFNSALTSHGVESPALTTTHLSTPVWFNPALNNFRPLGTSLVGTHISSPLSLNPVPNRHVALGASYTTTHVGPPALFSPALNQPAIGPSFKSPHNLSVPNPGLISYGAVIPATSSQAVLKTPIIGAEVPDKTVSYSLSDADYEYLKRHKTEGKDSPYNPAYHTVSQPLQYLNTHAQHSSDSARPSDGLKQSSGIHVNDEGSAYTKPSEDNVLKRSSEYDIYDTKSEYSESGFGAFEPVVSKHISFHVPPPDFEEPPATPVVLPPRKKNYNILFIKAPSQERHNYDAYLHQQSQVEEKTLIYVLAKTQEQPQPEILLPTEQKISSPEVFFVNYRTKLGALSEINDGVVGSDLQDNISTVLEHKRSIKDSQSEEKPKGKM